MHEIVIERWEPTRLNTLMGIHWSKANRLKKADAVMIGSYSGHIPKATAKRKVELIIQMAPKQRCSDPDSHQKSVGDALVKCRLLVNDSHLWVEWLPTKFIRGKNKTTTIRLYEADEI